MAALGRKHGIAAQMARHGSCDGVCWDIAASRGIWVAEGAARAHL